MKQFVILHIFLTSHVPRVLQVNKMYNIWSVRKRYLRTVPIPLRLRRVPDVFFDVVDFLLSGSVAFEVNDEAADIGDLA